MHPWAIEVDGIALPRPIAGHPVVELCNTRAAWGSAAPKEYLHSYRHFIVWARSHGFADPATADAAIAAAAAHPRSAAAWLARVMVLRAAIYDIGVHGGPPDQLDDEIARAAAAMSLGRGELTYAAPTFRAPGDPMRAPFAAIVWASAGFFAGALLGSVRACPGRGCGWAFYDPLGRRCWCSMSWCGNRAKARRYSEKRAHPVG